MLTDDNEDVVLSPPVQPSLLFFSLLLFAVESCSCSATFWAAFSALDSDPDSFIGPADEDDLELVSPNLGGDMNARRGECVALACRAPTESVVRLDALRSTFCPTFFSLA